MSRSDNADNRCMEVNYGAVKSMKSVLVVGKMNHDVEPYLITASVWKVIFSIFSLFSKVSMGSIYY